MEVTDLPPVARTPPVGSGVRAWRAVEALKRDGAVHSDAGMASVRIIPAFDPLEYGVREFFSCFPGSGIEELQLHRVPERFHHRIVVTITDGSHGAEQPGIAESFPERPRSILRSVVGMQDGGITTG